MKYVSTNRACPSVSGSGALLTGLAADGGLFLPEVLPTFSESWFRSLSSLTFPEICLDVALSYFQDEMGKTELRPLIEDAFSFPVPLRAVDENIFSLELFHGPTLAFKDFGARFLARMMSHFRKNETSPLTVLVATSGDTGSAVAHGFYRVPGISVVILYPSGKVSPLQEKQLTTLGENITALEIAGTFDDCQKLVKEAFIDPLLTNKISLTSANSINIGRLIPQSFYYYYAVAQLRGSLKDSRPVVFSVPSGNLGNLTAGILAKRSGLNVRKFLAACNQNSVFREYLRTGVFTPKPSVSTLSNAMDVGNPSNFARLLNLYDNSHTEMAADIFGYSTNDSETKREILKYHQKGYTFDPHGAVGVIAFDTYRRLDGESVGIILETAHPAKFIETVEEAIDSKVVLPEALLEVMKKEKRAVKLSARYQELREYLLARA